MWIEIHVLCFQLYFQLSRLARALWIEISVSRQWHDWRICRGSREPCGLKYFVKYMFDKFMTSRLARALWIEIMKLTASSDMSSRRGSREPCGLKYNDWIKGNKYLSRGSREPCGLKCHASLCVYKHRQVEARESLVD